MIKKKLNPIAGIIIMMVLCTSLAHAKVQITGVSISTRILLDIYKVSQQEGQSISEISPNVLIMTANSDESARSWAIEIKVYDGTQWVAGVDVGVAELKPGINRYNASQFDVSSSVPKFNDNYQPSFDAADFASGNILPINNFKIIITPKPPQVGPSYTLSMGLFSPRAAMNRPPVVVYPRDVAVNTVLPNFSWMPAGDAKTYEVVVGPNIDPQVNSYWTSPRVSSLQVTYDAKARALKPDEKYYWKVIAYNAVGQPVGGNQGQSQVAWFKINQSTQAGSTVSPEEADRVVKQVMKDKKILSELRYYLPVSVESTCQDLAELLKNLKDGSAKIINQQLK